MQPQFLGKPFIVPISAVTPSGTTNPCFLLRPQLGSILHVVELCLIATTGISYLEQSIRTIATASIGTAINLFNPDGSGNVNVGATATANAGAAGTAVGNIGPKYGAPLAVPAIYKGENPLASLRAVEAFVVTFAAGDGAPVNTGAQISMTVNGVAYIFECGAGTDTADAKIGKAGTFFVAAGATYTDFAVNFAAKVNQAFAVNAASSAAAVATVPKHLGRGLTVTAMSKPTDAGAEITIANDNFQYIAFRATTTNVLDGYMRCIEVPGF